MSSCKRQRLRVDHYKTMGLGLEPTINRTVGAVHMFSMKSIMWQYNLTRCPTECTIDYAHIPG